MELMLKRGFTIVELLIVIVVIGILAAITMVSYTGITNQAKISQVKANIGQVANRLETWKIQNGEVYPADEVTAELIIGSSLSKYMYSVNSVTSESNYCATYSSDSISYSVTSKSSIPIEGECVENLSINPSFESNGNYWDVFGLSIGWVFSSIGVLNNGGAIDDHYYRAVVGVVGSNSFGPYNTDTADISINVGDKFTISSHVRLSWAGSSLQPCNLAYTARDATHSYMGGGTNLLNVGGGTEVLGTWERCWRKIEAVPSGSIATYLRIEPRAMSYESVVISDTFDIDGVMITKGDAYYNYGDGNSLGWFWTGVGNNSTSIGPAKVRQ